MHPSANPNCGGMDMNTTDYWHLFLQTGAPVFYVKYHQAKRMETSYAFDNSRPGASGHGLQ